MGGSRSGGSEDREEKKIPTYADQLKKGVNISHGPQGSGRYKLTDKGLEKSPTFLWDTSMRSTSTNTLSIDSKLHLVILANKDKFWYAVKYS